VTYFVPIFETGRQKMVVVQTALLLAFAGLLIGLGTFLFAGPLAARIGTPALAPLLRLFFLFPIFSLPLAFVDSLLIAIHEAKAAAWLNILSSSIQFAVIVGPVEAGADLRTVIILLNLSAILRFAAASVYVMSRYRGEKLVWDRGFIRDQLKYSLPLGLSSIVGTLTYQLDRIVITAMFTTRDYAVYANGATEIPLVGVIAGSVMTVVTPEFVRLYHAGASEEIVRLWHSATRKVAFLFFPMTTFLMAFSGSLIALLFSRRYLESTPLFQVYLLLMPLRITVYGSVLMAAGESSLILTAAAGTLLMNAALIYPLIKLLGMPGAAWSTVAATYALGAWQLNRCVILLKVRWREIFPWADLARIMGISIVGAAIAWALTARMPVGPLRLMAGFVLFCGITSPLLWYGANARLDYGGFVARLRERAPIVR
jgi:O-antigen/teichoic acid export membrane protein